MRNADDDSHYNEWRELLVMNARNKKDQPPSQGARPRRLPIQVATIEPQQENLAEQISLYGNQQGGAGEPRAPARHFWNS